MNVFVPSSDSWPSCDWQRWASAVGEAVALRENPAPLCDAQTAPLPRPLREASQSWRLVHVDVLSDVAAAIEVGAFSPAHEIARALHSLVQVWRAQTSSALDLPHRLTIRSGTDVFTVVSKLRALRVLASALATHCERPTPVIRVRVEVIGLRAQDAATALVRQTVEAMAGVLGLADELEIVPLAEGDDASWRAQALGHVLREESGLGSLADPVAGSHWVEQTTASLSREAWTLFQRLEAGEDLPAEQASEPNTIVGVTDFVS